MRLRFELLTLNFKHETRKLRATPTHLQPTLSTHHLRPKLRPVASANRRALQSVGRGHVDLENTLDGHDHLLLGLTEAAAVIFR